MKLLSEKSGVSQPRPRIRLLTFTRAATSELAYKVSEHPDSATLRPSTIHSFAISVLLQNPGCTDFPLFLRIADSWENKEIIEPTIRDSSGFSISIIKKFFVEMSAAWESLEESPNEQITEEQRARFIGIWHEHRNIFGYTLLAELPYRLRSALIEHPDLQGLEFDALFVDEYQDLNACDLHLIKLISQTGCSILAAGDDDQSIYSFRKAAPEGIRRFPTDYPGANDYTLSVSMRCGRHILNWANHVIQGATDRPAQRAIVNPSPHCPDGEVALLAFSNQATEANGVARLASNLIQLQGIEPSEILILVRADQNRRFSNLLRPALEEVGVPVSDPSRVDEALREPSNRRLISLARLICNNEDSLAWASLFTLERGIGSTFLNYIYDKAQMSECTFYEALREEYQDEFIQGPASVRKKANSLFKRTHQWLERHQIPPESPQEGWGHWLLRLSNDEEDLQLSDFFCSLLTEIDELSDSCEDLDRFLSQITPIGHDIAFSRGEGVRIMTMSSSKGLTVRATIIVGVEEGIIPHPRASRSEERRLLYVAMTRAREFLYLAWARIRRGQTARVGRENIQWRHSSNFLDGGPVITSDGAQFIDNRFGRIE